MTAYNLTDPQAKLLRDVIKSHCNALKNWLASSVEHSDFDRSRELVTELRAYEELYAKFYVEEREP